MLQSSRARQQSATEIVLIVERVTVSRQARGSTAVKGTARFHAALAKN